MNELNLDLLEPGDYQLDLEEDTYWFTLGNYSLYIRDHRYVHVISAYKINKEMEDPIFEFSLDKEIDIKSKFYLGDHVIVNTGGNDTQAIIDYPVNNINGYYWKTQDCYLCRFTTNIEKTFFGGVVLNASYDGTQHLLYGNVQYIPAQYIKLRSNEV